MGACLSNWMTFPATEKPGTQEEVVVEEESGSRRGWVCGPLEMQEGQGHSERCRSRDGQSPREDWVNRQLRETRKVVPRARQRALQFCPESPSQSVVTIESHTHILH